MKAHCRSLLKRNCIEDQLGARARQTPALFLQALTGIGGAPFVEWRYAYEIEQPMLMSHGAVAEVLDAIGYAAEHVMKGRRAAAVIASS